MSIVYFSEGTFLKLNHKRKISSWLLAVIRQENYQLIQLTFIFCTDPYLLEKNKTYLGHDTLTDVLTFDYATAATTIWGDIYISIERVRENAKKYRYNFQRELYTVMVHGLLHLLSYGDQTIREKKIMRQKEAFYVHQLSLLLHTEMETLT